MSAPSPSSGARPRRSIDPFTVAMMVAIAVAAIVPVRGDTAVLFGKIGTWLIAILFFGHGAALSFVEVVAGLKQWKLHLLIFVTTFVLFPLVVVPGRFLPAFVMPADLYLGFLYLGALPSAVSGSIAFTAVAEGNVPAAVCASATSNTVGLMVTPFIVALTMGASSAGGLDLGQALIDVVLELLLPFTLGQLIHPLIREQVKRHGSLLHHYDQSVIVFVIYVAFSQSIADGLWGRLPIHILLFAILICAALMFVAICFEQEASRRLGLTRSDEIAAVFCGSKKSLASGLPLAKVLFGHSPSFGMIIIPIMLYNQVQTLIGAFLAQRYARGQETRIWSAVRGRSSELPEGPLSHEVAASRSQERRDVSHEVLPPML